MSSLVLDEAVVKKRKKKTLADVKVRIPLPQKPPKVITPETVYDRKKEKKKEE